jgi:hypothetical protein
LRTALLSLDPEDQALVIASFHDGTPLRLKRARGR